MATSQVDRTGGPASSLATDRGQGLVSGAAVKGPCYLATTASITLAGEQTIDGVAATAGKRVLVKDQADGKQNGIYLVATGDWQRAPDFASNDSVREGTRVFVTDGATYAGTEFTVTTSDTISIGTSSITFALSSAIQAAGIVAAALPDVIALASDEAFVDADMLIARQASSGNIIKRSWANVKNLIRTALGAMVSASGAKSTPVDADQVLLSDSASSNATAKLSWANIKATLNTYFQGLASLTLVAGDILYASGANTLARLAKGSDGQILTLASGIPAWADAPASGGMTLIGTINTTSGTSQSLTGIPSGYKYLKLIFKGVSASSPWGLQMSLSSTNGAAYGAAAAVTTAASFTATRSLYGCIDIYGYDSAVTGKALLGVLTQDNGAGSVGAMPTVAVTNTAAACNAIRVAPDAGNFDAGTVEVYGVN